MFSCEKLYQVFDKNNLTFFTGVPDLILKDLTNFLTYEHGNRLTNIIACNECEATATAAGYYLATGKMGVVYMQNSGLGKTVNPLTSLCDPEVYSIPLMLLIGLRGEPGINDEPPHIKMGRITLPLLETLEIPYKIMPYTIEKAEKVIEEMKNKAERISVPVAIVIRKGTLEKYEAKKKVKTDYEMKREDAIKAIVDSLDRLEVIVSTTGNTCKELFEYQVARNEKPSDFYTLGSMGCAASIANGIALQKPNKHIFVFDGDGSVIMQMGALATIGNYKAKNLYHVVFDNGTYDSTGGQPTVSSNIDLEKIAIGCGYKSARTVETKKSLVMAVQVMKDSEGPQMLIVKVNTGARKDLGRLTATPIEIKNAFMEVLK